MWKILEMCYKINRITNVNGEESSDRSQTENFMEMRLWQRKCGLYVRGKDFGNKRTLENNGSIMQFMRKQMEYFVKMHG